MTTKSSSRKGIEVFQCAECGMPRKLWKGNEGQGVQKKNQTYCCDGCARGTACTC